MLLSPGPPISIVIACSVGISIDANSALKQLVSQFGGKGGGKREMAQGGGLTGSVEQIASAARTVLESMLSPGASGSQ